MPHTPHRLRQLMEELERVQHETGDMALQARQELAGLIASTALRPAEPAGAPRKKKAGKKKR